MASPGGSGTYSSGSSSLQNSGSEGDRDIMEQRKRKRMLSNRESARRSRIRKQQHLEGLSAQLDQLKKENAQINTNISITTQMYLKVEAENAILRAQMGELSNRLNSLNEMISFINSTNSNCLMMFDEAQETTTQLFNDCGFMDYAWNGIPIMASADNEMLIMY
ncbi:bZIP transcription factor 11-like [Glycine soja]|uniref:BZIP transcription factor 44 n=1 Tax=Glycine soja TaxID=3848 RepID=A0A445KPI5_GLYSO|nr:bZIP transcription factor 11-like [Glycine soja]KHN06386.1 Ocs element-binding factor 1 [Glycine soja]RZC12653.1 bZIP transcription factor 44 [Glycine soja]